MNNINSAAKEFLTQDGNLIDTIMTLYHVAEKGSLKRVLLSGETGTGKELVARGIHEHSPRRNKPFVAVNCSAIPESLSASYFFGHMKGSFTGAHNNYPGMFGLANGGTLFLDEIGEMDLSLQANLLRVLDDSSYYSFGSSEPSEPDVMVLAATNREKEELLKTMGFRLDLFNRFRSKIFIKPLRERKNDVAFLAKTFLKRLCKNVGVQKRFSHEVVTAFEKHIWPGNVRELECAIEHAFTFTSDDPGYEITMDDVYKLDILPSEPIESIHQLDLRETIRQLPIESALQFFNTETSREIKRDILIRALEKIGNVAEIARMAGAGRTKIVEIIKSLGLKRQSKFLQ